MVDADVIHILEALATTKTGRTFRLAGGTALALQLGHRRSNDLDYFAFADRLNRTAVMADVERLAATIGPAQATTLTSSQVDLEVGRPGRKVSFIAYPFAPLSEPVELHGQPCSSVAEIAAMKAYALGRRAAARDYVDIEAAITSGGVELGEIIDCARRRFIVDGEPAFSERLFLQQIVDTSDVTDSSSLALLHSSWSDVQVSLRRIVADYAGSQTR